MNATPAPWTWLCQRCTTKQPISCPRCLFCGTRFSGDGGLWNVGAVRFDSLAWGPIMDRQQQDREPNQVRGAIDLERFIRVRMGHGNCFFDCRFPGECKNAPWPFLPLCSSPASQVTVPEEEEGEKREEKQQEKEKEEGQEETHKPAMAKCQRRRTVHGCRWEEDDAYKAAERRHREHLRRRKSTGDCKGKYGGRSNVHPWKK